MEPSLTHSDKEWHLKGALHGGNEILNCVFTYTAESDGAAMKSLFDSIAYIGM